MNDKEYIYILDYSNSTICEIVRGVDDKLEIEDVLKKHGCNINTCSWMITDHKINEITTLNMG